MPVISRSADLLHWLGLKRHLHVQLEISCAPETETLFMSFTLLVTADSAERARPKVRARVRVMEAGIVVD